MKNYLPENPFVGEEGSSISREKLHRYTDENRQSHETEPNMCPINGRYIIRVVRALISCSSNGKKTAGSQLHDV